MSLKVEKRRNELISIINIDGTCYISEAAKLFNVTHETIRNDFDFLLNKYGYERSHGGIKNKVTQTQTYDYHQKKVINVEEKKRLCFKMVELLHDGDYIYVDSGSTVTYLLNYLNKVQNVTMVTPSIAILMRYIVEGYERIFKENGHELIFVGGKVNTGLQSTYGAFFDEMISDINFDKMIFSCDALDIDRGVTNGDETSYAMIRKATRHCNMKYLLADSSKFDKASKYKIMNLSDIDFLITDYELDKKWMEHVVKENVYYIKA